MGRSCWGRWRSRECRGFRDFSARMRFCGRRMGRGTRGDWGGRCCGAWGWGGGGVVAAGMTAFYMFRLLLRAFYGEARYGEAAAHHLHESPRVMAVPLMEIG